MKLYELKAVINNLSDDLDVEINLLDVVDEGVHGKSYHHYQGQVSGIEISTDKLIIDGIK